MPTAQRQSNHGNVAYMLKRGINLLPMSGVMGPLANKLDDLTLIMKHFYSKRMFEMSPLLPKMPFDNELYEKTLTSKRLRIGILKDYEESSGMCPAVKRALKETHEILQKLGHEVIEIEIPNIDEHMNNQVKLVINMIFPLMLECWNEKCDDLQQLAPLFMLFNLPQCFKQGVASCLKMLKQYRLAQILETAQLLNNDGFAYIQQVRAVHLEMVNKIWIDNQLDSLIVSPIQFPSFKS